MKNLILFLLALLLASPAVAAEKTTFRAFTNNVTCAQMVSRLEQPEGVSAFALMVSAFITGANFAKGRDSSMDLKSMLTLTELYCRQNPEWSATTALVALDKVIDRRIELEKINSQ